jgi:hypothetical protein
LAPRIVLGAVPGNHGENRNSSGKAYTTATDNDDLAVFEGVAEILAANPERYGHVHTVLAEALGMAIENVAGVLETQAHGEGITQGEIQIEVDRILNPRTGRKRRGETTPPQRDAAAGGRFLNVELLETFPPITTVHTIPYDPAKHAAAARLVARWSRSLRRYFLLLGLRYESQRRRMRGRAVDRTALQAALQRGDPRVLVARELRRRADLFIGILIDCSGSMTADNNIDKARTFGTLVAEAARRLPNVDVRIFGFTDSVIFDAGTADRCATYGLRAGGGNNDAGALAHAARVAAASRRSSRLLVMISDGTPTECTVAALRALVARVSRRPHTVCTQVALRPLPPQDVCFPHYIELLDEAFDAAARRFGRIVERLVGKTLNGR